MCRYRSIVAMVCAPTMVFLAAVAALSAGAGQAQAGIILDFEGGTLAGPLAGRTYGWEFNISAPKLLTSLGFWDDFNNGPGLGEFGDFGHEVAIWTSAELLLAEVRVTNATSTPVASSNSFGRWLFEDLDAPLTLAPGNYILGARYRQQVGGDALRINPSSMSLAPDVTFIQGRSSGDSFGLVMFPSQTFSSGVFGPNALLADVNAVPEPASVCLVVMGGLSLLGYRSRRQRRLNRTHGGIPWSASHASSSWPVVTD